MEAFGGRAPDQGRIAAEGSSYLAAFPDLDYVTSCTLAWQSDWPLAPAAAEGEDVAAGGERPAAEGVAAATEDATAASAAAAAAGEGGAASRGEGAAAASATGGARPPPPSPDRAPPPPQPLPRFDVKKLPVKLNGDAEQKFFW